MMTLFRSPRFNRASRATTTTGLLLLSLVGWWSSAFAVDESTRADFYVAKNGNDQWSGKLASPNSKQTDGPFATLASARNAIRDLKKQSDKKDLIVRIRDGSYPL